MTTIQELLKLAANNTTGKIAVAAAHDEDVLKAVADARRRNIVRAILVGDIEKIKAILSVLGEDPADMR
jgi:phosphate butyryltransferase